MSSLAKKTWISEQKKCSKTPNTLTHICEVQFRRKKLQNFSTKKTLKPTQNNCSYMTKVLVFICLNFLKTKIKRKFKKNEQLFVLAIENGEEFCYRVCFSFFVFNSKSGTTKNYRTGLSDILYKNAYSRDLIHVKKLQKQFLQCREKPVRNF